MFARTPHAIRSLGGSDRKIYLTFDDGPDAQTTPPVLDLLAKHDAHATFFMIATQAEKERALFERIRAEHAIGNHSLDHNYSAFFGGVSRLRPWIEKSQAKFNDLGVAPVGFRPPAGLCTPPLIEALEELNLPLILWTHRFYDTTFTWTASRLRPATARLKDGDLVLLHDRQKARSRATFLATLDLFLNEATLKGFSFSRLPGDFGRPLQA